MTTHDKAAKPHSWKQEYERLYSAIATCPPQAFVDQLERAEKEMPELYAALNLLAVGVHGEIEDLDRKRTEGDAESPINSLPVNLVSALARLRLAISTKDLCEKLNRWYAWVHFQNLRRGIVQEPGHCDS
jgi:hypothetical protein